MSFLYNWYSFFGALVLPVGDRVILGEAIKTEHGFCCHSWSGCMSKLLGDRGDYTGSDTLCDCCYCGAYELRFSETCRFGCPRGGLGDMLGPAGSPIFLGSWLTAAVPHCDD